MSDSLYVYLVAFVLFVAGCFVGVTVEQTRINNKCLTDNAHMTYKDALTKCSEIVK